MASRKSVKAPLAAASAGGSGVWLMPASSDSAPAGARDLAVQPNRHPGESRDPPCRNSLAVGWTPAFAGVTDMQAQSVEVTLHALRSLSYLFTLAISSSTLSVGTSPVVTTLPPWMRHRRKGPVMSPF